MVSCLNEMSPYLLRAFSVLEMHNINIKFFFVARSRHPSSVRTLKSFFTSQTYSSQYSKCSSAIRWIDFYPVDNAIDFPNNNTYPLDTDLSGRWIAPSNV